jgi:hypothetical protein
VVRKIVLEHRRDERHVDVADYPLSAAVGDGQSGPCLAVGEPPTRQSLRGLPTARRGRAGQRSDACLASSAASRVCRAPSQAQTIPPLYVPEVGDSRASRQDRERPRTPPPRSLSHRDAARRSRSRCRRCRGTHRRGVSARLRHAAPRPCSAARAYSSLTAASSRSKRADWVPITLFSAESPSKPPFPASSSKKSPNSASRRNNGAAPCRG